MYWFFWAIQKHKETSVFLKSQAGMYRVEHPVDTREGENKRELR